VHTTWTPFLERARSRTAPLHTSQKLKCPGQPHPPTRSPALPTPRIPKFRATCIRNAPGGTKKWRHAGGGIPAPLGVVFVLRASKRRSEGGQVGGRRDAWWSAWVGNAGKGARAHGRGCVRFDAPSLPRRRLGYLHRRRALAHATRDGTMRVREFSCRWVWSLCRRASHRRSEGREGAKEGREQTRLGVDGWGNAGWRGARTTRAAGLRTPACCPSLSDSLPTSIGDPPSPMRVRKSHRRAWALRCRRAHVAGGVPVMGRMVRCGLATKRVHHAVGSSGFDARASSVWAKYFSILPLGLQENRVISIITRLHSFLLAPPGALSAVTNIRSVSTSGWPSVSLCNSDA
jgi:hypothetical protein